MSALAVASVASLATAGGHVVNYLPMPAWAYGVVALVVVVLLLVFTWLFRHTAAVMIDGDRGRGAHGREAHGAQGEHGAQGQGGTRAERSGRRGSH